jgi:hypothetical protein
MGTNFITDVMKLKVKVKLPLCFFFKLSTMP